MLLAAIGIAYRRTVMSSSLLSLLPLITVA